MMYRRTVLLLLLAIASACGADGPATPSVAGLRIGEIILVPTGDEPIYSHEDHWHGAPLVDVGVSTAFAVHFIEAPLSSGDHDVAPQELWFTLADHPEYELRAVIEDPSIATWTGDRTGGALRGTVSGASRISFVVRRGTTTIYEAPPLNFRVR